MSDESKEPDYLTGARVILAGEEGMLSASVLAEMLRGMYEAGQRGEREACAVAVRALLSGSIGDDAMDDGWDAAVDEAEAAIRARGTVPR